MKSFWRCSFQKFPPFQSLYCCSSIHQWPSPLPLLTPIPLHSHPQRPIFFHSLHGCRVLDASAMFTSNGGAAAKNSRKRKMKKVAAEAAAEPRPEAPHHQMNLFNLHGQQFASPNTVPLPFASPSVPLNFASPSTPVNGRHLQVQQILNNAAPLKPFSFTSLLTAEDEDDHDSLSADIKRQTREIDQIVLLHSENLRQALGGVLEQHQQTLDRVADERAAKRTKEREFELQAKNAELERKVEHYKEEAERLLIQVRYLERATMSLQAGLREANAARRYAETEQEDAESSFEDPDRVGPVRLECKACERQLATVMMWPCRHVCMCTHCDAVTKACPVCRSIKTTSVEVCLPHN